MHYEAYSTFSIDSTKPIIRRKSATDTCLMFGNDIGFTKVK